MEGQPRIGIPFSILNQQKDTVVKSITKPDGNAIVHLKSGLSYLLIPSDAPEPLTFQFPFQAIKPFVIQYQYPDKRTFDIKTPPRKGMQNLYSGSKGLIWPQQRKFIPTHEFPVNMTFRNFNGAPLSKDTIYIRSNWYSTTFAFPLDSMGFMQTTLPAEDSLWVGFDAFPYYDLLYLPSGSVTAYSFTYAAAGTNTYRTFEYLKQERKKEGVKRQPKYHPGQQVLMQDNTQKSLTTMIKKGSIPKNMELLQLLSTITWNENDVVVMDVTGSMKRHFEALVTWFVNTTQKTHKPMKIVLFNDGDGADDRLKRIGKTGGIYCFHTQNVDTLIYYISMASSKGNGGDVMENVMEAIQEGYRWSKSTHVNNIFLLGDGLAPIREPIGDSLSLPPVHVLLPGKFPQGIQADYLKLAHLTKGYVKLYGQQWQKENDTLIFKTAPNKTLVLLMENGRVIEKIIDSSP